ncbi:MAG: iron-sulfur cluster assembly accessory protein [Chloroflexi bacterium]|nr:iron-sulfur cluster assembly accessory protein [Chloroflexota bacterium]
MGLDGVHDLAGYARLLEQGPAVLGMARRIPLVVVVVEQARHRPLFGVAVVAGRETTHRRLDREPVLAQALAGRVLAEQGPGLIACHLVGDRWYPRVVIEVTPAAVSKLQEIRPSNEDGRILRVYVAGKSCCGYQYGLALDELADGDELSVHDGIAFAIDAASAPLVRGATVDFVDEDAGSGFIVRNPTLGGGGCGCGRS